MTMVVPTYLPCHSSHFPLPLKRRILPHDQWNQWKTLLLRILFFLFLLVESTFLQRPSARQDCMSVPVRQKSFSETKWSSEPLRAFVRNKLLKAAVESTVRRLQAFTGMDIISPRIGGSTLFLLACNFSIISAHSLSRLWFFNGRWMCVSFCWMKPVMPPPIKTKT